MRKFFYQILFLDGRIIRRSNVPRYLAHAAADFCKHEMILLGIKSVTYGPMEDSK